MYAYIDLKEKVHRMIPSKFPPVSLFDWAESPEELEEIALLEGLTNERIVAELGYINLVTKEDWVGGEGSTPLMAAFTHIGFPSRFSDGSFGIYYAATTLEAAIKETIFHRARFYSASKESPCSVSMREYITKVQEPLVDLCFETYSTLLDPDPLSYTTSQDFGKKIRMEKQWGLHYPSVRDPNSQCVAIFKPKALSIPTQGGHYKYIWDGSSISSVYKESRLKNF